MSISATHLPDILRDERDPRNSISVLRALKNIREQLDRVDASPGTEWEDCLNVAYDDIDTMIAKVASGKDLEAESI